MRRTRRAAPSSSPTFGQFDGEKLAGDLDLSRQFGQDVKSVQNLPATQQARCSPLARRCRARASRWPRSATSMLARAVDAVQKERQQDPALSVMRNSPQVQAAYQTYAQRRRDPMDQTAAAQAYAAATSPSSSASKSATRRS
jgi:hypothetical protein